MPMYDPPHPGEMIRDILEDEEVGWTVTECAKRLDVARNTLSRLLNGRLGISPRMALALENIGWSNADHWMRLQAAYDLAQERLRRRNADRRTLATSPTCRAATPATSSPGSGPWQGSDTAVPET